MRITAIVLAAVIAIAIHPVRAADHPAEAAAGAHVPRPAAAEHNRYFERASELVIHALALIGVGYKYGGNTVANGLDCSGLVSMVFQDVAGLALPRNSQAMSKVGSKVDKTELQPGDLVFFNTLKHPYSHVGIYIGEARFVHAPSRGREVEVADMHDRYWQKRYNGARRVNF